MLEDIIGSRLCQVFEGRVYGGVETPNKEAGQTHAQAHPLNPNKRAEWERWADVDIYIYISAQARADNKLHVL